MVSETNIVSQANRMSYAAPLLLLALGLFIFGTASPAPAAAPSPLDGFDPNANDTVNVMAVQPDGKVLLGGAFTQIDGTARNHIARLNPDGSLDTSFNPGTGVTGINTASVSALVLQPSGKILVGGMFTGINGTTRHCIARLNANGSLDATFDPGTGANDIVLAVAAQPNGKVLLGGTFTSINGTNCNRIARLNADGSLDTSFVLGRDVNIGDVFAMALQADGKVLLGGNLQIMRLNANGSRDTAFTPAGTDNRVEALAVQPDGKVLAGGDFTRINTGTRSRVARLNADGSLDTSFNSGMGVDDGMAQAGFVRALAVQPDGKVLLGGWFSSFNGTTRKGIARLNTNGSLDTAFDPGMGEYGDVHALAVPADGKVLLGGYFSSISGTERHNLARLNPDGSLEKTFNIDKGVNDEVYALGLQADGKAILGGGFTSIGGNARNRIARLNADGSLDFNFFPGTGAKNGYIYALAAQPDGKVLLAGSFTMINDTARTGIARLNADGSLDAAFNPITTGTGGINALAMQPDGKVLLCGHFGSINGTTRDGIARLNADGSLDDTFVPGIDGTYVVALVVQPDGKVLLGGYIHNTHGPDFVFFTRLNADGSADTTFTPGTGTNGNVYALALQADGKILLGGTFSSDNGTARNGIARLNIDGTLDTTFNPGTGLNGQMDPLDFEVHSLALQADGRILVGGRFYKVNGTVRNNLVRLNANGSLDATFVPGTEPVSESVIALALQDDGKLLLNTRIPQGGVGGYGTNKVIGRLTNPNAARQALAVAPGGGSVTWALGGSFPQPYQVLFEESADGAAWNKLGWGVAVPGVGYRLNGLHLPVKTNHYLRATGWVTGGQNNGSVSLHRSVLRFYAAPYPSSVAEWLFYD